MSRVQNSELRPCAGCGGGIAGGKGGPLAGARITVERLVVAQDRLNQHLGLETHFGLAGGAGARALADVMGPGSVLDAPPELKSDFLLCDDCLITDGMPVLVYVEADAERVAKAQAEAADNG